MARATAQVRTRSSRFIRMPLLNPFDISSMGEEVGTTVQRYLVA
jgi:hypothetical protein